VTNEQYELFDPAHRERGWAEREHTYRIIPREDKDAGCPAVNVSWYDVWAFCCWLGAGYRLPTEAEWEFACRATRSKDPAESTAWCFGKDRDMLRQYAWYDENSDDHTHPVGELKANAWGLYDMHGNVFEWTDSSYAYDPREASDSVDETVSARVCRGGSWRRLAWYTRSANRTDWQPSHRLYDVGFRLARALHENL
jgi:formylglycine-generating enzyme required for sulfatase activity